MQLSVVLYLMLISTVKAEIWRLKRRASEWTFQMVRKSIDTSVIVETVTSESLTGCAAFCSNLDSIVVPSLYFIQETGECVCNSGPDGTSEDENQPEIAYGTRRTLLQVDVAEGPFTRTTVWPYNPDCSSLYDSSYHQDGVYVIYPLGGYLTDTWCDMANGGWTVIQRRMDGSENFYRGWNDYVSGFGNRTGEFWLGLENIHHLTKNSSELTIYMEQYPGTTPLSMTANYSHFSVGDNSTQYTLDVNGYNGNCRGDALPYHNGQPFSTFDKDNDKSSYYNCAEQWKGAWWFHSCLWTHLNGVYNNRGSFGIYWIYCWDGNQSSKFTIMKLRRHS